MTCKLICYSIPDPRYGASGGFGITVARCETHNWDIGQMPITSNYVCPIGRIEEARDHAIEAIEKAKIK